MSGSNMSTSHSNMTEHMKGSMWLDAAKYPTIEFTLKNVDEVKKLDGEDDSWSMSVTGDFSMHGVTKSMTVPVTVTYLPGQLKKRQRVAGDLVVLRSKFTIDRTDFKVGDSRGFDVTARDVNISLAVSAFVADAAK